MIGLLLRAIPLLDKWLPNTERRDELAARMTVTAIESMGWAHRIVAVVFGVSLALNLNALYLVPLIFGQFVPAIWWALFLQFAVLMSLLGWSPRQIKEVWDQVKDERDGK